MKQKDMKKLKDASHGLTPNIRYLLRDMKRAAVLGYDYVIAQPPRVIINDADVKELSHLGYQVDISHDGECKIWFDLDAYENHKK